MNSNSTSPTAAHWLRRILLKEAVLSSLLIFCFIGIAYTNFGSTDSMNYWLWMIPVFAFAAILTEWTRYRQGKITGWQFTYQQALHWGAVFLAFKVVFILLSLGRLPNAGAAFMLMMLMSLASFLAGIYIGWQFILLGAFIALATVLAAYVETFVWILIPITLILIAIIIAWGIHEFRQLAKPVTPHTPTDNDD